MAVTLSKITTFCFFQIPHFIIFYIFLFVFPKEVSEQKFPQLPPDDDEEEEEVDQEVVGEPEEGAELVKIKK